MSQSEGKGNGQGPRLTVAAQAIRDSAIMAQLHAGEKVRDVARAHELTTRQVQRIAKNFEIRRTALEDRPMAIVERTLREIEERMRNFALIAAETIASSQPAVALGALKAQAEQHERYVELLGDIGKLPDNLEVFKSITEVEKLGERLLDLAQELAEGRISGVELEEAAAAYVEELRRFRAIDSTAVELPAITEVSGDGDPDRAG